MHSIPRFASFCVLILFGLLLSPPIQASASSTLSKADPASELLKQVTKKGDKVEASIFDQIANLQTPEAFEASMEATKKVKKQPMLNKAYGAFALYRDSDLRLRAIEFLAKDTSRHRKKYNQRAAARGLAKFRGEAGQELLLLLREHGKEEIREIVTWPVIHILAELDTAESLGLMMDNIHPKASKRGGEVAAGLRDFESKQAIVVMLLAVVDLEVSLGWRDLLLERLVKVEGPEVDACLVDLIGSSDFSQQMVAIEEVGKRRLKQAEGALLEQLRGDNQPILRAAIVALAQFVPDTEPWRKTLSNLASDKRPAARLGAAVALAELRTPEALELLYGLVADPDHAVRIVAVQEAGNLRRKDVIPLLISRLPKEHGRIKDHVAMVLRLVTGEDFGTGGRWNAWWADQGDAFVIPEYDDALAAERSRRSHEKAGGTEASFYGLNIVSKRVCFIMDTSGSMQEPAPVEDSGSTSGGSTMSTRIEIAKMQLSKALAGLADEMLFNMIFFSGDAKPWKKKLTEMDKSTRAASLKHVSRQGAGGGTAVYDALALAFEDDRVDTIYLLTDGAPSAGTIVDPDRIAQAIQRINSTRMVQINCISIGSQSQLLRTLAADSGGTYREVL
ncbi:MAG: hypothetical protein ACI8Q9_000988 [Planctomycetota bacterium]|jgi:hypothetical protein